MKIAGFCLVICVGMNMYGLLQAKQAGHFFNILYYGFQVIFGGLVFIGLSIQAFSRRTNHDNPGKR